MGASGGLASLGSGGNPLFSMGANQALTFLREVDCINMRRRTRMMELTRELVGGSLIGARVAVVRKGQQPVWRRVHTDSGYLSAQDVRVHFGLGDQAALVGVLVDWPDHTQERFEGIKADRIVTLRQGSGKRLLP